MNSNIFIILALFVSLNFDIYSQREYYNWLIGRCGDRSDSIFSRILWTFEDNGAYKEQRTYKVDYRMDYTNASISNDLGKLLFYTNGLSVFNSYFEIMPNGDGLNPGSYATSSKDSGYKLIGGVLILPWPEHPNKNFILHLTTDMVPFTWYSLNLFTTLVDMELDQGKGNVVYKNRSVFMDSLVNGSLAACRHANGRDWWIPCFYYSGKKCLMFLLDPSGVKLDHIEEIPFEFEPSGVGQAQFSPDGSKYSFFHRNSQNYKEFILADFDRCNGTLSKTSYHTLANYDFVGAAFSPNSRFLYLSTAYELLQLDMMEQKPFDTRIRIDSIDGFEWMPLFPCYFSFMQLAPDNKIYINNGRAPAYLSTIENPDLKGNACNVRQHNIPITSNATLPNFPYFRLGALEGSTCDTLARGRLPIADWSNKEDTLNHLKFDFIDKSFYEVREWYWDFGDPSSLDNQSNFQNPVHKFSQNGFYDVCLIVKNKIGADTLCRTLQIVTVSATNYQEKIQIMLFPNPIKEYFVLNITGYKPENMKMNIYEINGKKTVQKRIIQGSNIIETKELNSGVYILKIYEREQLINTIRLIKI